MTACPTKTRMKTDTTTILAIDNGTRSVRALAEDVAPEHLFDQLASSVPPWAWACTATCTSACPARST